MKDHLGNTIELPVLPSRIISLVPSQTELLFDLGLDKEVIGITKFCVHPEPWRLEKTIVGGTKNINHNEVDKLKPDLIIANKEENTQADILQLQQKYPVWVSDVSTIEDAYSMISSVGELTGKSKQANMIMGEIKTGFTSLPAFKPKRALYLIWKKPWMTVGPDTFIHAMMKLSGFENVIVEPRYPELSDESISSLNPEVILLSSEPYPFGTQHAEEIRKLLPSSEVKVVDGEIFSWYGSRMKSAAEYFRQLSTTL